MSKALNFKGIHPYAADFGSLVIANKTFNLNYTPIYQ